MNGQRMRGRKGRRRPRGTGRSVRVMFYSHDTYGLGHLRRTLTIARHLQGHLSGVTQLVVTGSPVAGDLVLPDDADYVKLPSVVKVGPEQYAARSMDASFDAMRAMRSALILDAARHFRPDVLLVDHAPAGVKGELTATLRHLKASSPGTRIVAGLRDVVDEPSRVKSAWTAEGVYPLLDQVYDRILVYGQRDVYDVVAQYGLSATAGAKTRFVGYLRREADGPADLGELLPPGDHLPLVVASAGGGGDGAALLANAVRAARTGAEAPAWRLLVVAGPLMDPVQRMEIEGLAADLPAVKVVTSVPGLAGLIARADAVLAMGGYNTVCELLSFGRPALIVPRVAPRREQLLRAEALARRGLVRVLHPEAAGPEGLGAAIGDLLAYPARPHVPVALDGLPNLTRELTALLNERHRAAAPWQPAPRLSLGWS